MTPGRDIPGVIAGSGPDIEQLLAEAGSPEDRVRRRAASRLGLCRDSRAVPALVGLLSDPRQSVRETAAEALRMRGGQDTAAALGGLLGSNDLGLRNRAGSALAGLGEHAVGVLVGAAAAAEPSTRKFALELMGEVRDPRAAATLVHGLRDPDPNVAFAAAESLGKFRGAEVATHLMDVFRERPELRCALAEALGRQGDPRAVPLLLESLDHDDLMVRFAAANALGQVGSPDTLRPLMSGYRGAPAPLRHAIIRAVSRLLEKGPVGEAADGSLDFMVPDLVDASGCEEWDIRLAALRVLALCPPSTAVTAVLAARLEDPVEEIRNQARRALERTPDDVVPHLVRVAREAGVAARCLALEMLASHSDPRVVEAMSELLSSDDERLRAAAALALGQCGRDGDGAPLVALLADPIPAVRACAARALGWLRVPEAAAALRARLDDEAPEVRESALGALVLLSGDDVVRSLNEDLHHPDPERRRLAVSALGFIGDEAVLEPLLEALHHGDEMVRQSAAVSLARLRDPRALEPLLPVLRDPAAGVRQSALQALAAIDMNAVFPQLTGMLEDPDPWVRYHLVNTLAGSGHPGVPDLLVRALGDPATVVTVAAAGGLGSLGVQEAVRPLVALLERPEEDLVRAAITALGRMGGEEVRAALDRVRAERPEWREVVDLASSFP
ncbi:MAG: HEAT repeat domain-containing protein [Candidatus Eisenbacteria bacterium]|nr:HEAT repeat domain-containing protein [Candidatus Eisenbacteria bacterium]